MSELQYIIICQLNCSTIVLFDNLQRTILKMSQLGAINSVLLPPWLNEGAYKSKSASGSSSSSNSGSLRSKVMSRFVANDDPVEEGIEDAVAGVGVGEF